MPTPADFGLAPEFTHLYSGKVRDLFRTPGGDLLLVASARISAYDWVLPTPIPGKGAVLTQMSRWWFNQLADVTPNHLLPIAPPAAVADRAVVCQSLDMFAVECVVRGYLTGSGLSDYQRTGSVCGVQLPSGLVDGDRLPEPIFTPATKAAIGDHDENVDFDYVVDLIGAEDAAVLRDRSLRIYATGEAIARDRGIILADTKFEFGRNPHDPTGEIVLADEVLTPDSSRYWPADTWQPGRTQPSYDKQYVRDWLTSPASGWDKNCGQAPPPLPEHVVEQTRAKYLEAFARLSRGTS